MATEKELQTAINNYVKELLCLKSRLNDHEKDIKSLRCELSNKTLRLIEVTEKYCTLADKYMYLSNKYVDLKLNKESGDE